MSDLSARILSLEQYVRDLQTELNAQRNQMIAQNSPRVVRLAEIATPPSSTGAKKFGVVFLNGEFDDTNTAVETAAFIQRQQTAEFVAYNLGDKTPSVGEKVICYEIGGRWWFNSSNSGTTTPAPDTVSDTMVMSGARYWYDVGPDAGTEYNVTPGLHINVGNRKRWRLSWRYNWNLRPWFMASPDNPWVYWITQPGMYLFTTSAEVLAVRRRTASPPPSPDNRYLYSVRFDPDPKSCTFNGNSVFGDSLALLRSPFRTQNFQANQSFVGSINDPQLGLIDNSSEQYLIGASVVRQVNLTPPSVRAMTFISEVSQPQDVDYGCYVHDITLSISRIAPNATTPGTCPVAINTVPS